MASLIDLEYWAHVSSCRSFLKSNQKEGNYPHNIYILYAPMTATCQANRYDIQCLMHFSPSAT